MNRYFYYSILMCMLMNTILYVPNILLANKHSGVTWGILISTIIGSTLAIMFSKAMAAFRNQGLQEIFSAHLPKFVRGAALLYLGIMWFIAGGLIVLVSYTVLIKRFVLPETSSAIILVLFMLAVSWCASKPTKSILYLLEMIILFNLPLILYILIKALDNKYMNWYSVWDIASDQFVKLPNMDIVVAATYVFTGYINMAVFNKESDGKFNPRFLWLIPVVGFGVLCTSFIIPIGFHGTIGVDHFTYAWISTADSIKINFGMVERAVYVFLLLYLNLSLLFATVSWHIGYHLIAGITHKEFRVGTVRLKPIVIFGSFMLATFIFNLRNEKQNIDFALDWLKLRFYSEAVLVLFVYYLSRKRKRA